MRAFLSKILVFLGIVAAVSVTMNLTAPAPASADCRYFLGMTSWDCKINENMSSEQDLTSNVAIIASNVLTDITVIASYLVIGYVMYGGYLYMFSSGDPSKAMAGKKTLQHAFIGLAIVMSAYAIFSAIRIALVGNASLADCSPTSGSECVDGGTMVTNLIQWVAGMAGVVSAIFVVVGGWGYVTSNGDPNKLQKAKTTILYALIGLVIVALTEVLTAFVSNLIRNANNGTTSYVEITQIINDKEFT